MNRSSLNMPNYELGVYEPENICIRCAEEASVCAQYSLATNMSTGFSDNLGFLMP